MAAQLLATDGYKFSMAEAGWPLRRETFYLSHRQGGLQVLPFDPVVELRSLLPRAEPGDWDHLAANEYEMGPAYRVAVTSGQVTVRGLPRLAVFSEREPIVSVTGPSALVSWLEPLILQWSYRIQVATAAVFEPSSLARAVGVVTCQAQERLVRETLEAVGVAAPPMRVDEAAYVERVRARVAELVDIVGAPSRLFEVGLRAASCVEQHLLALEGAKAAGLSRTSHVLGARRLGMTPVGTMGHEHVQRYGSDRVAFRAMVERRHQRSSFLLDTFDTVSSGLPAAFELLRERPAERDSIRYDSGDKVAQYRLANRLAREAGLRPVHILEDGFDAALTRRFEALREEEGVAPEEQVYGYGGYLIAQTADTPFTRDRVSAVYKLSQTGHQPTMKFADDGITTGSGVAPSLTGKRSAPGCPVLFRRLAAEDAAAGPFGLIGQEGEAPPPGYTLLTGAAPAASDLAALSEARRLGPQARPVGLSKATAELVSSLSSWRRP